MINPLSKLKSFLILSDFGFLNLMILFLIISAFEMKSSITNGLSLLKNPGENSIKLFLIV